MMRLLSVPLILGLGLATPGAFAACSRDAAPSVPDGKVATLDEMKAAQQAIKAYIASSNAYLACLDQEGQGAPADEPAEAKAARVASYNAAVDEQSAVAAQFNTARQAFNARQ
jgi:hypothetical protein